MNNDADKGWYWWAGYNGDVECEGLYALGEYSTRDEAIAAGRAHMPDIDGNTFFHIVQAQFGEPEVEEDCGCDFLPFSKVRNHEIVDGEVKA